MKKNNVCVPWELNKHLIAIIPCDAYKLVHRLMYPKNTVNLYSTFTARRSANPQFSDIAWNSTFARKIVKHVFNSFSSSVIKLSNENATGPITKLLKNKIDSIFENKKFTNNFLDNLKKLGQSIAHCNCLPLSVKIHKSEEHLPFQKVLLTITGKRNIAPEFVWLINYFETILLENLWQYNTSLTIARDYYELVLKFAEQTSTKKDFVRFQCHDFSMRGMSSLYSAIYSANAHLQYFDGSDTIIGGKNAKAVFASEHSVMCADGSEHEYETFDRLINEFPLGNLSLVSDSWNLWNVVDNIIPSLKKVIMKRKGKVVIRPDSGDPIKIICGTDNFSWDDKSTWGVIHYLDHHFGVKINKKGYKELNPKIGIIYGDAITFQRTKLILEKLAQQKYASSNIVFGVGATTYQAVTRDTLGFVAKATAIQKLENGKKVWVNIEKDPVTDHRKKSLTGRFLNDKSLVQIY